MNFEKIPPEEEASEKTKKEGKKTKGKEKETSSSSKNNQGPKDQSPKNQTFTDKERKMMIESSKRLQYREERRSGGVDPNE